jgi:hypothetical protein
MAPPGAVPPLGPSVGGRMPLSLSISSAARQARRRLAATPGFTATAVLDARESAGRHVRLRCRRELCMMIVIYETNRSYT